MSEEFQLINVIKPIYDRIPKVFKVIGIGIFVFVIATMVLPEMIS